MKRIIIDIDNTLWDFASVMYQRLRAIDPEIPPVDDWREWEFWGRNIDAKTFYKTMNEIHIRQDQFNPFDDAAWFLTSLRQRDLYIIIASHREKGSYQPTARWLKKHGLSHDEVHLSYDKSVLFGKCFAIVDDSPSTLQKAKEAGIVRTGLRYPWNKDTGHPLFHTLPEILGYIDSMRGTS